MTKHYSTHVVEGAGLFLLGDLQVLMDSESPTSAGFPVWKNNHKWKVLSWKFYPTSYVHVVETTSGLRVYMFVDQDYPLSLSLLEKMLKHNLEVPPNPVGNARLFAESLIRLIKAKIWGKGAI